MNHLPPLSGSGVAFRPAPVSGAAEVDLVQPGWSYPAEGKEQRQLLFLLSLAATAVLAGLAIVGEAGVLADQRN